MAATIAELLLERTGDPNPGLRFEDRTWTYAELVEECAVRAAFLAAHRPPDAPFHVGVLLDNVPEFWMVLGAAALAGAVVVGINPTRRGPELARDVTHTDCALLVTEGRHTALLDGAGLEHLPRFDVDAPEWPATLAPFAGAPVPEPAVDPSDPFVLVFTSGTTGAPKAVRMGHGRLAVYGSRLAEGFGLAPADVCYSAMPLFHSNALVAGYTGPLRAGATTVLRRRFSASAFLADVRRYGVTWCNYVGKPLTYVLATPEQSDDADNPLRIAFGNEASPRDVERFATRFGCLVVDGYGSTEGGVTMSRTPETPAGSLGIPVNSNAAILDQETGAECPRARFDADGRLLNPEAIGEIVNPDGPGGFEGYYNNPEADAARMRNGAYWTGDLGYRDEAGFFYFAGRDSDWLRVDGENFAAAPLEAMLGRHPDVVLAAVYAVPAADAGDDVMATLLLREGAEFDPEAFAGFLAAQPDCSPQWRPRYVRVSESLPTTETMKVVKRILRQQRWDTPDPVWWRPDRADQWQALGAADREAIRDRFAEHGRTHLLGTA